MKRVAFLLGLFAILFASCSSQFDESKTNVSIQLPSARAIDNTTDEQTIYGVAVSLSIDGVVKMQTGTISAFTESTFTFNEIEIGASAVASCEISANGVVVWQGTSDEVKITEGVNIIINMTKIETPIEVTGITLSQTELSIFIDQEETLTATVEPSDATNKTIEWSVSDKEIIGFEEANNGVKIIPLAEGTATITAKTANGISASCEITVITTFDQERFRALLPDYAANTKNEFAIPEGYTKIAGVNNGVDANNSPNMESVFNGWAALSLADALPTIKIPSTVVYIDAAAFYGLHNEGKPFVTLEFEDYDGWAFTGTMETYDDTGAITSVDVTDYYSLDFNEYLSYLVAGKGHLRKLDLLSVELPIGDNNFGLSVKDSEGNFIYDDPISKGTTLVFGIQFFMNDNNENGSTFVPTSYKWYIDGVLQENETGKTFTWDTTDKASGTYEIMCVIDDKYSAIQTITLGTRQE